MKVAFDIGGVLSKYPAVFRRVLWALQLLMTPTKDDEPIEVHIVSDMHDKPKMLAMLKDNGFGFIPEGRVHCADYETHGELCKAALCAGLGIDVLVDDFPGYVATANMPPVRLLVMPDPTKPYYHDDWKTEGSEGNFGRRRNPMKNAKEVDHA